MQIQDMKAMSRFLVILFFALIMVSCGKDTSAKTTETDVEFRLETLANKGWKSKKINQYINEINYTATEVPNAYYILKEMGTSDLAVVDSVMNLNSNERVIEVEFAHVESKDLLKEEFTNLSYEEAVKYMAFKLNKDFMVITSSNDTIPCVGVQFERNFKVAPFKRALIYFTGIPEEEQIQLIYTDKLFNNGIIKFNFNRKELVN